ncbi:methylated-DNA-protein-cysteine methyltransferase-like protein [Bacillus mesophilus]|uniref:MGMT family protein n=1 Tax=Bacillus mesophilus TaxID=1808955 RepID=A0A6M0QCT4_9BACI|nr:MGMT family protein [Bacillus mesophilus]MBM7663477.1 methylated-DNA-protein-cysteine methyltransferase-like protein [Bacillus mesophilus]NEY74173.1 MGMT family protein [Bacillus mesophilus]
MTPFTKGVLEIILQIPSGKVMTYGQVASLAGSPRAARQVVRILHSMSEKHCLPWHRVMNKEGYITINDEALYSEQVLLLENEGVRVSSNGHIDLAKYNWNLQP